MAGQSFSRGKNTFYGEQGLKKFWSDMVAGQQWADVFDIHNGVFEVSCSEQISALLKFRIESKMRALMISQHFDVEYDHQRGTALVCLSPSLSPKAYAELAHLVFTYQSRYGYKVLPPALARVPVSSNLA